LLYLVLHYFICYLAVSISFIFYFFIFHSLTFPSHLLSFGVGIAQTVQQLAMGWTVRGSNPDEGEIFRTGTDRPWVQPSLLYNGYRVFPGGKAAGAWC
jgi:hypothetical protein